MTDRMRKVNALLLPLVAAEVENLKDPRLGFVTITAIETAPNLRNADVFYSVIGTEEELASTAAGLQAAAPRVTRVVGSQVRLKYTPVLHFKLDRSTAEGVRMADLLRRLNEEEE